jgi:DNA repair photolyase
MKIRSIQAKSILTPQKGGFLTAGERPYTHSLSWATGCQLGKLYCGAFCYAQMLPNWHFSRRAGEKWGEALIVKENAPALLEAQLARTRDRRQMRIFMSPVTDPYQPIERKLRLTRRCLQVFSRYDDLDLLLIQTRGPSVVDDLDLIAAIPYAWLGMTIETDRQDLPYGPSRSQVERRLAAVKRAVERGIKAQIAVSPCLPYSPDFAERLLETGAQRIVIDTFAIGDGSGGRRTGNSPFAASADYDWRDDGIAISLYHQLSAFHDSVEWSGPGFAGIPARPAIEP